MKPIIFLDIDGVLNCEIFFKGKSRDIKKRLIKEVKSKAMQRLEYYGLQLCQERIGWLNELCKDTGAVVVISSTWRKNNTVEELQRILNYSGATFTVIDKTPYTGYERGTEIAKWLRDNVSKITEIGSYSEFDDYVIIDDDSDMLLNQAPHFFKVDGYSGLTPNVCYKIHRFLTGKYPVANVNKA